MAPRAKTLLSCVVAAFLLVVAPAFPGPGDLDPTFGTGGKHTTTFGASVGEATSVALQPDGKLVTAGHYAGQFGVARHNADGSPDPTFDGDGKLTTPVGVEDQAWAVALQPDGKIVAAGYSSNGTNYDFALVRYHANGALDTTFGGDGIVTTAIGAGNDEAYGLALQPDGKIVAAGRSSVGTNTDFGVARYNADGSLDTTFGGAPGPGWVRTALGSGDDAAFGVKVQADGKIVAAGSGSNGTNLDVAVVRYESNGWMEASSTTPIGSSDDEAYALALQADGKIVVAGRRSDGANDDFALARYRPDLTLDPAFDGDGKVTTGIATDDEAWAVAVQPDGKLVAAGQAGGGGSYDFALARYQTDGSLDTGFGSGGKLTTSFGSLDYGYGVALQPDGKIVMAGSAVTDHTVWGLARYVADGTAPGNPGVTSPSHTVGTWSADPTVEIGFTGASDEWSGVDGFSFQWEGNATTTPDTIKDAEETASSTTSQSLADGSWWFHLRTGDNAGNWSGTASVGPFRIDTTAPVNPELSSSSHTVSAWSRDSSAAIAWSGASDGGSGLDGLSFEWSQSATTVPDTTKDAEETVAGLTSARPDGTWWFHLRTGDTVGNWSAPVHLGPFSIDATAPAEATVAALAAFQLGRSLRLGWSTNEPATAVASYDVRYRRAPVSGGFHPPLVWRRGETSTGAALSVLPGSTYCLSASVSDAAGNQSSFGSEACSAIPADDRALTRRGSWVRKARRGSYLGSHLASARRGDSLSLPVSAKRLALVATSCPRCGTVEVHLGSRMLRRIDLRGKTTTHKRLIHVATFARVRTGMVRIKIVSAKMPVLVDGLGVSRV